MFAISSNQRALPFYYLLGDSLYSVSKTQQICCLLQKVFPNAHPYFLHNALCLTPIQNSESNRQELVSITYYQGLEYHPAHSTCPLIICSVKNEHNPNKDTSLDYCPTLCNSLNCSTPGFPVLHYFPEFA